MEGLVSVNIVIYTVCVYNICCLIILVLVEFEYRLE